MLESSIFKKKGLSVLITSNTNIQDVNLTVIHKSKIQIHSQNTKNNTNKFHSLSNIYHYQFILTQFKLYIFKFKISFAYNPHCMRKLIKMKKNLFPPKITTKEDRKLIDCLNQKHTKEETWKLKKIKKKTEILPIVKIH